MNGLGMIEPTATTKLHEKLKTSRVGQRWERMIRRHALEVETMLAVHPGVREDVKDALTRLSNDEPVDSDTTRAVERVLDDLQRHASVPLQRDITRMRDELILARGQTLEEILGT
ncbi:MAG: hypothetical protein QG622_1388 [Actinomycetota bacterium]|nr:hypothetical protein [Actinomycetota bacterium]